MPFVEGFGDEVIVLLAVLTGLVLLSLAWISTSVADRPLLRIVILDRARFQEFVQRFRTITRRTSSENIAVSAPSEHSLDQEATNQVQSLRDSRDTSIQQRTNEHVNPDTASDTPAECATSLDETEQLPKSVLESFLSSTHQPGSFENITEHPNDHGETCDPSQQQSIQASPPSTSSAAVPKTDGDSSTLNHSFTDSTSHVRENEQLSVDLPLEEEQREGCIKIRLKFFDERQKLVQANLQDTIGHFKREHFAVELADNFAVRFIYRGQELKEDRSTLQANNISDNSVIHCLLSKINQSEPQNQQVHRSEVDLGVLMFPLFGVILALIWYCRFIYRSYFSAMSTLCLIGITLLFLIALLASFRRGAHTHVD